MLAEFDKNHTKMSEFWPELIRFRTSAKIWPSWAKFGRVRPNLDQLGQTLTEIGPNLARFGELGKRCSTIGRARPEFGDQVHGEFTQEIAARLEFS